MKKRYGWKFVIFMFLIGLMGCSREEAEGIEKEDAQKTEKLVLWSYYETKVQQDGLDKLTRKFNESQKKYEISWEYIPMAEFTKSLSFSHVPEEMPDLVLVDNPDMESLIKIGLLADITQDLEGKISVEEYYPEVWKSVEYQGSYYGVPFNCNSTAIIYNKRLFREYGIDEPVTWTDFKKAAAELTASEGKIRYGFAMSAVGGEQGAFQFMPWILATGADTEDLSDKKVKDAFSLIHHLLSDNSMPNDCLNWSQNDLTRSFVAGEVAMIENGPWAMPEIEKSGIEYGIFKLPAYATQAAVLGGENLAPVKGKNIEGAIAFIDFYNQKEIMEEICQITRNIPPKVELAESFRRNNPNYQVFIDQMKRGTSRSTVKNWKNVCRAISSSLNRMFGSDYTIEEVWKEYVSNLNQ